jgi:hypothetical protein
MLGEIMFLGSVAEAMASVRATAGDGFHKPTFEGSIKGFTDALANAAINGDLIVCDQYSSEMPFAQVVKIAKAKGLFNEDQNGANAALAANLFVSLERLNQWGTPRGDSFVIEYAPWIDERGWQGLNGGKPPNLQFHSTPLSAGISEVAKPSVDNTKPDSDDLAKLPAGPNWKMLVQAEATALCLRLRATGANPTRSSILGPMATWCVDNDIRTLNKIHPSANYLRTHVLGGKHWDVPN